MKNENKEFFECQCFTPHHVVAAEYDPEDNVVFFSLQAHIWQGFFKRLKMVFLFLFKRENLVWDTCIIQYDDVERLQRLIDKTKKRDVAQPG